MRLAAKERVSNHVMGEAKRKCYSANIKITVNEAVVLLQDLLTQTTHQLAQVHTDVMLQNISEDFGTTYYRCLL